VSGSGGVKFYEFLNRELWGQEDRRVGWDSESVVVRGREALVVSWHAYYARRYRKGRALNKYREYISCKHGFTPKGYAPTRTDVVVVMVLWSTALSHTSCSIQTLSSPLLLAYIFIPFSRVGPTKLIDTLHKEGPLRLSFFWITDELTHWAPDKICWHNVIRKEGNEMIDMCISKVLIRIGP
jgi:hypothetical protein